MLSFNPYKFTVMRKILFIFLFIPVLLFGQQIAYKTITVEPHMYTQNYEHFNRLVLRSPDSQAEFIDGFDFEWGYYYTLKVKEEKIGPLSDGTMYDYSLLKIISKKPAPDSMQFIMYIDPLFYYHKSEESLVTLSAINDSIYLYMEKVEIEIPFKLNENFHKKIDNDKGFRGSFKFVNSKRIRLVNFR